MYFERLPVEPFAAALIACDMEIGKKVHGDAPLAQPLTGFAAAALGVETEPAGAITADLGLAGCSEDPADLVDQSRGRGRRGAGTAPDRSLIDFDELIDRLETINHLGPITVAAGAMEI